MKQLINILVLLAVFCLFGAPSCSDQGGRNSRIDRYLTGLRDTVISQFQKTPENEIDLAGYSRVAVQKIYDFADYMNIVTDRTVESDFRSQAADMLTRLFVEGDNKIEFAGLDESGTISYPLDSILLSARINEGSLNRISVSDVVLISSYKEIAPDIFLSVLSFREDVWNEKNQKQSCMAEADVILKKELKNFGKDFFRVWTVRLGDIRCTQEKSFSIK